MFKYSLFFLCALMFDSGNLTSQIIRDSTDLNNIKILEKDVVDLYRVYVRHNKQGQKKEEEKKFNLAFVPAVGYSLQTGVTALFGLNITFDATKDSATKTSTILTSIIYTQYKQIIIPLQASIWSRNNNFNFITDARYMNYPSLTFGLGKKALIADPQNIDFSYVKVHQTILRKVFKNTFLGAGYYLDYLYNEKEINPPAGTITSFERYGLYPQETASGICLQGLYDDRKNAINSVKGFYANIRYRNNYKAMGSTSNWSSGTIELKKYIPLSKKRHQVLALWSYNSFIINGKAPYLLLPSIGWDDFFNTGRGYIQGRFRGGQMYYVESEYRFNILKSGLIGGVLFANAQTYNHFYTIKSQNIIPGGGVGFRLKLNKHSATNLCIDYGWGINGSRGFFINLGEVF